METTNMEPGMDMEQNMQQPMMHPGEIIIAAAEELADKYLKLKVKYLAKEIEEEYSGESSDEMEEPIDHKLMKCLDFTTNIMRVITDHVNMLAGGMPQEDDFEEEAIEEDDEEFVD